MTCFVSATEQDHNIISRAIYKHTTVAAAIEEARLFAEFWQRRMIDHGNGTTKTDNIFEALREQDRAHDIFYHARHISTDEKNRDGTLAHCRDAHNLIKHVFNSAFTIKNLNSITFARKNGAFDHTTKVNEAMVGARERLLAPVTKCVCKASKDTTTHFMKGSRAIYARRTPSGKGESLTRTGGLYDIQSIRKE